jgi:hypothetical protein
MVGVLHQYDPHIKDRNSIFTKLKRISFLKKKENQITNQRDQKDDESYFLMIRSLRQIFREHSASVISMGLGKESYWNPQKINILCDALVYLTLKGQVIKGFNPSSNERVKIICNPPLFKKFIADMEKKTVCFSNALESASLIFAGKKVNPKKIESLVHLPQLSNHPDIKIALQMYFMKGKFCWVNYERSEFKNFLLNPSSKDLNENAKINCWESILYGFMKCGFLSKKEVQTCYEGNKHVIVGKLSKWVNFNDAKYLSLKGNPILEWQNALRGKTYFMMMDHPEEMGLSHNMLATSYSQKQILKMMLTQKFDEKPLNPKIHSHWDKWTYGHLGTVRKRDFEEFMKTPYKDFKVNSLNEFIQRGKSLSKRNWMDERSDMTINI